MPDRKAAARRRKPRPEPEGDSSVYDGGRLLGDIRAREGLFRAILASGKKLGDFKTSREAMRAICHADRAARLATAA